MTEHNVPPDGQNRNELLTPSLVQGELRILDTNLAGRLGFTKPANIRKLINRHRANLEVMGTVSTVETVRRGQDTTEYYLNRKQAIFITAKSDTPAATDITIEIIERFDAYERGAAAAQASTPEPTLPLTPDEVRSYVSLVNAGRRIYGNRAAHFLWKQTPLPQIPGELMDNTVRSMTADEVSQLCWGIEDFYGAYGVLKSAGITHREAQTWARWHVQRTLERRVERMAAFRLTSENDELF